MEGKSQIRDYHHGIHRFRNYFAGHLRTTYDVGAILGLAAHKDVSRARNYVIVCREIQNAFSNVKAQEGNSKQ